MEGDGTAAGGARFKFKEQIRDASESAVRNVAEGFGRYNPTEFARFLDIARASTLETKALLKKGLEVNYWPDDEFDRLDGLANRGLQVIAKFQRYLRSPQAKRNAERYRYAVQKRRVANENGTKNDPNVSNDPNAPNDP